MKKITALLTFVLLTTLVITAAEKSDSLENDMKKAGGNMSSLRKSVEAKNKAQAIKAAQELEKILGQTEKFFAKRKTEDAVKWARDAKDAAKALASAARKNDDANVASSLKALGASCSSCHEAHREKLGDGKYKLK